MSESQFFYQGFMSAIQQRIPQRAMLANTITELLNIEKDAVYRRLRGDANFSFTEMALIARNLGISLDSIAGIENLQSKPSKMNISRPVNPTEVDFEMFEGHVQLLKSIKDEPATKIFAAGNQLPHYLYQDYEYLTRFYRFQWNQCSGYGNACPYHEIVEPERLLIMQKENSRYARHISSTYYVFDSMIFHRLVTNIRYFAKVHLIKTEDVLLIKNDLTALLNNMEKLTITGKHEETGNEVSIFISDTDCDTNYSCLKSKNIQMTLFWTFILNAIVSMDEDVFKETTTWIRSLQRTSTLISVSSELTRTAFFNAQRVIINSLLND